ncbi:MAG TPA: type II toxin-antitoxin system RelE/ParE family toxin [Rhizomicrobium sp.]
MAWNVELAPEFEPEADALPEDVRRQLVASAIVLRTEGPMAKRPHVDTLKGSKHANMKELRFSAAGGVWRIAFAFDPVRNAILLVAGDKSGKSERIFYKRLIAIADRRFDRHLQGAAARQGGS